MILMSIVSQKCKLLQGNSNLFGTQDTFCCDFREMHEAGELTAVHVLAGSRRAATARLSAALSLPWWITSFLFCPLPWVLRGKLQEHVPTPTAAQLCGHFPSLSRVLTLQMNRSEQRYQGPYFWHDKGFAFQALARCDEMGNVRKTGGSTVGTSIPYLTMWQRFVLAIMAGRLEVILNE